MKFRIKVEVLKNGYTEYTPQVKTKWYDFDWKNIVSDRYDDFFISETMRVIYDSETTALEAIEGYKRFLGIEESKKIKETYFIKVN